jgi:soluble lytic murein transglycosylase
LGVRIPRIAAGIALGLIAGAWLAVVEGDTSSSAGSLVRALDSGHGIALDASSLEAAHALAEARGALESGELQEVGPALERARQSEPLGDYVVLYEARMQQREGEASAAATTAREGLIAYPDSPLLPRLRQVEGDALAANGDERGARAAWLAALEASEDDETRRTLRLDIVRSRQRSGELDAKADPDQLAAELFAESARPDELPAGRRSAATALLAGDELRDKGLGEQAIAAYDEALGGELTEEQRAHAQMQRGRALFGLRRYREAIVAFGSLGTDPEARYWHARSNARARRVGPAIVEFEALGESAPPEWASRSLFLAGLLLEDKGEVERAMAHYRRVASFEEFPERAAEALWRSGWWVYRQGDFARARERLLKMAERIENPIDQLRPRYWAARAADGNGDGKLAHTELEAIANEYPLSYYGWRAGERLDPSNAAILVRGPAEARPPSTLDDARLRRIALLLEAGLDEGARGELEPLAASSETLADRMVVGRLLAAARDYNAAQRLIVDAYALDLSRGVQIGNERLWWLSWPPAYRERVEASTAPSETVEPALVWAIMREESSFRPEVTSSAGAMGLLQLMPETAQRTAKRSGYGAFEVEALHTPETNIALGTAYLDHLRGRFPGHMSAAIGSYNAGPLAVRRWLDEEGAKLEDDVWVEEIPYSQTRSYVKRVLRSLYVYRSFY